MATPCELMIMLKAGILTEGDINNKKSRKAVNNNQTKDVKFYAICAPLKSHLSLTRLMVQFFIGAQRIVFIARRVLYFDRKLQFNERALLLMQLCIFQLCPFQLAMKYSEVNRQVVH